MRKILCVLCLVIILPQVVFADFDKDNIKERVYVLEQYNIIEKDNLENKNITREECIVSIVKAIGATEFTNERYKNMLYNRPVFRDDFSDIDNEGYILFAGSTNIARGCYSKNNNINPGMYFYPNKNITYNEMLLFMMRILNDFWSEIIYGDLGEKIINEDTELMIQRAEDLGLIYKNDAFYDNLDAFVLRDDFYELLYRFINQKRYYYQDNLVYTKDEERCMTYLEFLKHRKL